MERTGIGADKSGIEVEVLRNGKEKYLKENKTFKIFSEHTC